MLSVVPALAAAPALAGQTPLANDSGTGGDEPVSLPAHLQDRGTGIVTSSLGTYVREGELLVIPLAAYGRDSNIEYDPNEFGYGSPTEFLGHYETSELVVRLAYGLNDRLALEFEAAGAQASLKTSPDDNTGMPDRLEESGLGNVEARVNWQLLPEQGNRPEVFTYATVSFPHDRAKPLTGTPDWFFTTGIGVIRGFDWGTVTVRSSVEFDLASQSVGDWGDTAIEYLKRLSPAWSLAGELLLRQGDEGLFVAEVQWEPSPNVAVKLTNAQGITSNGLDWVPQLAVVFRFPDN
jgi:hypothetical protein